MNTLIIMLIWHTFSHTYDHKNKLNDSYNYLGRLIRACVLVNVYIYEIYLSTLIYIKMTREH